MHKAKKIYPPLISIFLALVFTFLFFALFGIFPFGNKTVSWCDMKQQTIPLLMNLKDILDGKSSILYSFSSGGGINFWGIFLFFLVSPLYLTVKFVSKHNIVYLVNILLALKLAICALTSTLYFSVSFKRLEKKYTVLFGLIYAFCGYGLMYYQTLVWLDIMYMFPLLVLSVEEMCFKKKCGFYIFMLSACVTVNYYLSIMVVIYLIISVTLTILFRCPGKERKTVSLKFILSSFSAMLITAPVWLCTIIQISKSARGMSNFSKFMNDALFQSFMDKVCIIVTDAFIFAALLFIIRSPVLKKRRTKYNLLILAFLTIPVLLDPINKMWHGGGYQGFPLRYGYMVIFTGLSVISEFFSYQTNTAKSNRLYTIISFTAAAAFAFTAIYAVLSRKKSLSVYTKTLWVTRDSFKIIAGLFILALCVYILFITLLRKKHITQNIFFILVSGVFLVESFVNMTIYVGYASSKDKLFDLTLAVENQISDPEFYRTKTEKKYVHINMLSGIGLNSYAHYTSLTPEAYMFAMKKLGYSSYWMEVGANGGTALTDALLGIRYSLGKSSDFKSYQKNLEKGTVIEIAQNQICAPAGIITDTDPTVAENFKSNDRFKIQQQFSKRLLGSDDALKRYDFTYITDGEYKYSDGKHNISSTEPDMSHCRINYDLNIKGHQTLYLDIFDQCSSRVNEPINDSVMISVNGETVSKSYPSKYNNGFLSLGEFENENVSIMITFLKNVSVSSFNVFGVDISKLKSEIDSLSTSSPKVSGHTLEAECSSQDNEYLYLAVPWDSGFKAYLNGKKTELYKVNDTFCAVKLENGHNNIRLVFYPEGFKVSFIIFTLGILMSVFTIRCKKITENKYAGAVSLIICRTAIISVILLIYIMPVIVYFAGIVIRFGR